MKKDILINEIYPKLQSFEDLRNDNKFEKPNIQIDAED